MLTETKNNSLRSIGCEINFAQRSVLIFRGIIEDRFFKDIKKRSISEVVILEGRPSLEAMKISCRQLLKQKITPTVIADNMAGFLFYNNFVKEVWLSYQIADDHGALCDIGSLILGVLAKKHKVPVILYPAAQKVNFIARPAEILKFNGQPVTRHRIKGYVPLMEWVPGKYISRIHE